jgi:hypothetical protein
MRLCFLLLIGLLVLGPFHSGISTAQQPPEPKDIPELKVLKQFAGKWQVTVTMKKCVWFPDGEKSEGSCRSYSALMSKNGRPLSRTRMARC